MAKKAQLDRARRQAHRAFPPKRTSPASRRQDRHQGTAKLDFAGGVQVDRPERRSKCERRALPQLPRPTRSIRGVCGAHVRRGPRSIRGPARCSVTRMFGIQDCGRGHRQEAGRKPGARRDDPGRQLRGARAAASWTSAVAACSTATSCAYKVTGTKDLPELECIHACRSPTGTTTPSAAGLGEPPSTASPAAAIGNAVFHATRRARSSPAHHT